ncbi:MAG: transcription termination/antitermination protein NusG [Bryobacteraceae bacterium]|jgi:transcription termination/antitermination protein NusG
MEAEKNFQPDEQPETAGPVEPENAEPNDMEEVTDQLNQSANEEEPEQEAAEPVAEAPADEAEAAPEAAAPAAEPAGYDESSPKKWFIIHTYSGFENKVAESLRTRADAFGFADKIGQILIPTEEVVELRNGKKVSSKRLVYPGYVLVEMEMNDQLWHEVKNTPRVTGFVGGGTSPVPLSADEVNQILYRQQSSAERPRPKMTFEKNDSVRIVDGPFANFSGKVDEVNPERGTLRVMVTIFGRATPVELEFLQVEKV